MKRYLVLYRTDGALQGMTPSQMFKNSSPEQLAAGMAAWDTWHKRVGKAVRDFGAPLDNARTISGGDVAPERTSITGYSILEAESMEQATGLLTDHPHFHMPGAKIEVLEAVDMPRI